MLLRQRFDVGFVSIGLLLSTGIAVLSALAGFSTWVAAVVGAATLPVCWWAYLTEP